MDTETSYTSEKGWECPRCGRINAPWVRQCDCSLSPSGWDKITVNPSDEWWNTSDTFKIHPESTIYTTNVNQVVGGSDYKGSIDYEEFLRQQLNYNYKFNNKNEDE